MMGYWTILSFSATVILVALFGFMKYNKARAFYNPFIYCIWAGATNEITSFIISRSGNYTLVNNHIYMLIEALLIVWQFRRWNRDGNDRQLLLYSQVMLVAWWTVEMFRISKGGNLFSFTLFYNVGIVLLSVRKLTKLIMISQQRLMTNPVFLFCSIFIFYFTASILTEAFWELDANKSVVYRNTVFTLMAWVNMLANLFYIYALLWIPTKMPATYTL